MGAGVTTLRKIYIPPFFRSLTHAAAQRTEQTCNHTQRNSPHTGDKAKTQFEKKQ